MGLSKAYDVIVVGGGPSGSTLATLVSAAGYRVLLIERERSPRYQVGGSVSPATVHGICSLLGVSELLRGAGFVKRHGVSIQWKPGLPICNYRFRDITPLGPDTGYGYQVERARFDELLLSNATRTGVEMLEGANAVELVQRDGRVVGVTFQIGGVTESRQAEYVVDAGGRSSSFYGNVGERLHWESGATASIHGYYLQESDAADQRNPWALFASTGDGWAWYIPLTGRRVSVGAVIPALRLNGGEDAEGLLEAHLSKCLEIQRRLQCASRITTGAYGAVEISTNYLYANSAFWCGGIVLVGDAACSVGPVLTSGIYLGMYSAVLAARSINTVLAGEMDELQAFIEFEYRFRREHASQHAQLARASALHNAGDTSFLSDLLAGASISGEPTFSGDRDAQEGAAIGAGTICHPLPLDIADEGWAVDQAVKGGIHRESVRLPLLQMAARRSRLVPSADGLRWSEAPA